MLLRVWRMAPSRKKHTLTEITAEENRETFDVFLQRLADGKERCFQCGKTATLRGILDDPLCDDCAEDVAGTPIWG